MQTYCTIPPHRHRVEWRALDTESAELHPCAASYPSCCAKQDLMGARAMSGTIQEGGGDPGGAGEGASATAAKRMVQAVQQFVAMLQIQQVRRGRPAAPCADIRRTALRCANLEGKCPTLFSLELN